MKAEAETIFRVGVDAVKGDNAIRRHCSLEAGRLLVDGRVFPLGDYRRILVIGAGKAGAAMAGAIEELLGPRITHGIVNVKHGHLADLKRVQLIEAAHPVPDEDGRTGAEAIFRLASEAERDDLILCLISGGASALLPLPVQGVSLKEKQATTEILLSCGATIHEINTVRKHISLVKGGGLARAAYPATLVTLILSDVVGDDLDVIGSGPTVPDSSRFFTCEEIFDKYDIRAMIPLSVRTHIHKGVRGEIADTPKPGDPVFAGTYPVIVANNRECIFAAEKKAKEIGYDTLLLSTMLEGEASEVARMHSAVAKEIHLSGNPIERPACILSGGETTVTIQGKGLGGRNQELALSAALGMAGLEKTVLLSAGTDGTDGPTDAAGAMVDGQTVERAWKSGLNPHTFLANNDAYHFFQALGDLVKTGPTGTNVMDVQIVLVR
jgi:hydroxypyruvate reductase